MVEVETDVAVPIVQTEKPENDEAVIVVLVLPEDVNVYDAEVLVAFLKPEEVVARGDADEVLRGVAEAVIVEVGRDIIDSLEEVLRAVSEDIGVIVVEFKGEEVLVELAVVVADELVVVADEPKLKANVPDGSGIVMVTVGGLAKLTSIIEYAVDITGDGVMVTKAVCVVSGPSIVFVEMMISVIGGRVSVSMIVFVAGTGVCTIVSSIVTAVGPFALVAAPPPSTGTTEYVALRTNGSGNATIRGANGSDEVKKKSDDKAKREELEVLRRMMVRWRG